MKYSIALIVVLLLGSLCFSADKQVIIRYKNTPSEKDHKAATEHGCKIKHKFWIVPAISATVSEDAIEALKSNKNIEAVEEEVIFKATDAELDAAWGVKRIGAGLVHDAGYFGTDIKVGIVDTGIDYNHPDLATNYAGGYDFVNNDSDPMDDNSHGTHVAGTVAALDNNVGVVGVGPRIKLYAIKVLSSTGSGSTSSIINGLQWCVQNGIKVTNNSYGSTSDPGTTMRAAIDNAYAAGCLCCVSAGNSGGALGYPAAYPNAFSVGATSSNDVKADFSSYGTMLDIMAPGVGINSTVPGGSYGYKSGTSMACPHITGCAAQIAAMGFGPAEITAILNESADDLGTTGRDDLYGNGLVNLPNAIELAKTYNPPNPDPDPDPTPDPPPPVANKVVVKSIEYSLANHNKDLMITITVTDNLGGAINTSTKIGISVYRNQAGGSGLSASSSNGVVKFKVRSAKSGTYSILINSIQSKYPWDGVTPTNSFVKK